MSIRRTVPAALALVLLVSFALPAAAQLQCDATPPAAPRAGFTCDPLQGGGQYTQTTCTFYGDIAWMIANFEGGVFPTNACGVTLTYANANWTTTPGYQQVNGDYIAGYCFSGEPAEILWQYCNVPVTSGAGLVLFVIAVAALGGIILWRRAA